MSDPAPDAEPVVEQGGEAPPAEEAAADLKRPLEEATEDAEGAGADGEEEGGEAPTKKTRVSRFTNSEPADAPVPSPEAVAAAAAAEAAIMAGVVPVVDEGKVDNLMALAKGTKADGAQTAEMQCAASKVGSRPRLPAPHPPTPPSRSDPVPAKPHYLLPRRLD